MNKPDIAYNIYCKIKNKSVSKDVALDAVNVMLDSMSSSLSSGRRVEIRGFGSLRLSVLNERRVRNPKTGVCFIAKKTYRVAFKSGKDLKRRVMKSFYKDIDKK